MSVLNFTFLLLSTCNAMFFAVISHSTLHTFDTATPWLPLILFVIYFSFLIPDLELITDFHDVPSSLINLHPHFALFEIVRFLIPIPPFFPLQQISHLTKCCLSVNSPAPYKKFFFFFLPICLPTDLGIQNMDNICIGRSDRFFLD